jgi:RecB family exonuclease
VGSVVHITAAPGGEQAADLLAGSLRRPISASGPESRRRLSDVTWTPETAPTAAELERALAAFGPRRSDPVPDRLSAEPLLARLEARDAVSARALENFADCPVKWLVQNVLRPRELVPDPEAMVRGNYAHQVLQRTFERLHEETGDRRVTSANLPRAERLLAEEMDRQGDQFKLSPNRTRVRAATRRLEVDLLRFLRREARRDDRFEPAHLEMEFGDDAGPPVELEPGLKVRGRIDRIDTTDGMALVIDYKSGKRVDSYKVGSWESENRFQAALYMLVVERLLQLRAAGGLYVPLGSNDPPRGMVAEGVDELGTGYTSTDVLPPDEFRAKLDWALGQVRATDARMRSGELGCDPDQCAWNGGCSYPSICRCEQ